MRSAQVIAHRPWKGASRPWPDGQQPCGIECCDGPCAISNLGHIHRRHSHHIAARLDKPRGNRHAGAEFIFMGAAEGAAMDQRSRCRGAAHIKGHKVGLSDRGAQTFGPHGPRGTAGGDEEDRLGLCHSSCRQPAIGIADQKRGRNAAKAQFMLKPFQIPADGGQDIGIYGGS